MVDVITKNEAEEFEDGELPEDGEICDDEEDEQLNNQVSKQSPLPNSSTSETTVSSSSTSSGSQRDRERDREREREKERDRERERNSRDRDRRIRRSDEQVHRDMDPFGPGKEEIMDYEGNDNGAAGYGNQSAAGPEEYNDVDYRVNRRRRHSPMAASSSSADSPPHYSHYPAKRPPPQNSYYNSRPASYRGGLGGAGAHPSTRYPQTTPRFNTEKQICKFFREGYCRDGDRCCYSHNTEDSLRRPILCNFYANSYCKKGLQCLMLHGEYPCKSFNQNNGVCDNLEQCKYSHLPLTEYTRPLYEASLSEDHPLSHPPYRPLPPPPPKPAGMAPMPSRRKVLLPGGPSNLASSPPSTIHAAIPQSINGGQLPPPSIVVPTKYPTTGFFNSGLPPVRNIEPPRPVISEILPKPMPVQPKPPQQAFNIEDMLNKLASGSSLTDDDSPASPPPLFPPVSSTSSISILPTSSSSANRLVAWRLIKCVRPTPYSGVENIELIASNDPRKARALSAQFDAFSNRLCSSSSNPNSSTISGDPRLPQSLMKKIDENVTSSWMPQMS